MDKQPSPQMDEAIRDDIIAKLRGGEPLPSDYYSFLFPPERRECELIYDGKSRQEEVLANTTPAPLQKISQFGEKTGGGGEKMDK